MLFPIDQIRLIGMRVDNRNTSPCNTLPASRIRRVRHNLLKRHPNVRARDVSPNISKRRFPLLLRIESDRTLGPKEESGTVGVKLAFLDVIDDVKGVFFGSLEGGVDAPYSYGCCDVHIGNWERGICEEE